MKQLKNWDYASIVDVLKANGFEEVSLGHAGGGSHHYFKKGQEYLVHVQYHAGKTIKEGTMHAIVNTSGLPRKYWESMATLGSRDRKKTPYEPTQ